MYQSIILAHNLWKKQKKYSHENISSFEMKKNAQAKKICYHVTSSSSSYSSVVENSSESLEGHKCSSLFGALGYLPSLPESLSLNHRLSKYFLCWLVQSPVAHNKRFFFSFQGMHELLAPIVYVLHEDARSCQHLEGSSLWVFLIHRFSKQKRVFYVNE